MADLEAVISVLGRVPSIQVQVLELVLHRSMAVVGLPLSLRIHRGTTVSHLRALVLIHCGGGGGGGDDDDIVTRCRCRPDVLLEARSG